MGKRTESIKGYTLLVDGVPQFMTGFEAGFIQSATAIKAKLEVLKAHYEKIYVGAKITTGKCTLKTGWDKD
jgi:hypothetical protein